MNNKVKYVKRQTSSNKKTKVTASAKLKGHNAAAFMDGKEKKIRFFFMIKKIFKY